MNKNDIYIIQGTDYLGMTKELLNECRLAELIPSGEARIAIKPNLVSPSEASYGATTHPEIVAGIIEYLQENGFRNLTVMESSWVGARTSDVFTLCGYDRLCEKYQVPFKDLQKDKAFRTDCAGMELQLCAAVKDVDFLINVPVLKGHCQTRITCALKNMKGLIPSSEKRRFHSLGLHKPIAHLNAAVRQDFIVVDNICGDPDFEDGGHPVIMNRILAALDPVLTDTYACRLLKTAPEDVPYILLAGKLGVGSADLSKARLVHLRNAREEELKATGRVFELRDAVEEVDSCSACYGSLLPALDRLQRERNLSTEEIAAAGICIGQGWKGKTGETGIGNCTRLFRHYLEGCPPEEDRIYEFLRERLEP